MKELRAMEQQLSAIRSICKERNLPTHGEDGIQNMYQINEQLRSHPGYGSVRDILNKSFAYIKAVRP